MPFQSEKQRRYLWANEPEIARDWTDTYGSGIAKALGGRIPFAEAGAVGALTAEEISELETMIQTYPDTKVAEDAQKKLDINAGKSVEKEDISWFEKLLGFSEAEGAKPTAKETADVERGTPVDEGEIQSILERDEAQSNMQQMMNPNYLESMFGDKGITKALPYNEMDDYEAQNLDIPRQQELARLAGMEQYPTTEEEDEDGNWWKNYGQVARSAIANKFGKGWLGSAFAGPIGWGASMAGGIGNFANTMRGGLTQSGYERARQNRINMQRQSDIIKTLQSKKYAPGWETTAFDRAQKLGKDLNLVDAADVGLTRTRPAKKTVTPRHAPHHDRGNGGGNVTPSDLGMSTTGGGDPFNRGGLAGLWRR